MQTTSAVSSVREDLYEEWHLDHLNWSSAYHPKQNAYVLNRALLRYLGEPAPPPPPAEPLSSGRSVEAGEAKLGSSQQVFLRDFYFIKKKSQVKSWFMPGV